MSDLSTVAVLIPAWRPEPVLASIVAELLEAGIGQIILVDDGSEGDAAAMLNAAASDARVSVVTHAVNLGKGRALKSGVHHLLTTQPGMMGVVTADADGQHTVNDILSVARALEANPGSVVLGARTFSSSVPLRSRFGNTLTCKVFGLVTGVKLVDTQTGLRGLPRKLLPELLGLEGERYEYEMTMLAHVCRGSSRPIEVPIETIYLDNNRSSHFDPVRDSMRIYFVLLRFYFSSLMADGLDFAGFLLTPLRRSRGKLSTGHGPRRRRSTYSEQS